MQELNLTLFFIACLACFGIGAFTGWICGFLTCMIHKMKSDDAKNDHQQAWAPQIPPLKQVSSIPNQLMTEEEWQKLRSYLKTPPAKERQ